MYENQHQTQKHYDDKAGNLLTMGARESSEMHHLKAFNNWIKAVLINRYCEERFTALRKAYDLPTSYAQKILHVLDIGAGHGQDLPKWGANKVGYLVAVDLSANSLKEYQTRWQRNQPYDLLTVNMSASDPSLYSHVEHSFYDIVSSQLCIHYMFDSQLNVRNLLSSSLENLMMDGYMLLTIPDSLTIVKKIRELGKKEGEYYVYGNKYFSLRFKNIYFDANESCYGLKYGFYLQEAIGTKNEDGTINYADQYLIEPENLKKMLAKQNMEVVEQLNFIEFYKTYAPQYADLFDRLKITFRPGESIKHEFWEIIHLYKVLVAKKIYGKTVREFPVQQRKKSRKVNTVRSTSYSGGHRGGYDQGQRGSSYDRPSRGGYQGQGYRGGDSRGGYSSYNNNNNYQGNYNPNYRGNNYRGGYRGSSQQGGSQHKHYSNDRDQGQQGYRSREHGTGNNQYHDRQHDNNNSYSRREF